MLSMLLEAQLLEACCCCGHSFVGKPWLKLCSRKPCCWKHAGAVGSLVFDSLLLGNLLAFLKSRRYPLVGNLLALVRPQIWETCCCCWKPCGWQLRYWTVAAVVGNPVVGNLKLLWVPSCWKLCRRELCHWKLCWTVVDYLFGNPIVGRVRNAIVVNLLLL